MTERLVWDVHDLDPSDGKRFGGKATGLARMVAAGIPVPPAFAIGTDAFHAFHANGQHLPDDLRQQIEKALDQLGDQVGRHFGKSENGEIPLLVSVRSGAYVSMPGMMDTVLNLGLDAKLAAGMVVQTGRRGFVIDTWLRFWKMYAEVVLGLDGADLASAIEVQRVAAIAGEVQLDTLEATTVSHILGQGEEAPVDPYAQLERTICAVFESWNSPRAKAYRKHHGISDDLGTAVTIQVMVFGNADENSGSGVAFSRNPNTGKPALYGEYLAGRQGEDIVSGAKTPVDLSRDDARYADLRTQLERYSRILEGIYHDAVDIEFTVESGKLYLLQVRPAKRTAEAAVQIAVDLMDEGQLDAATGLQRVSADQIKRLLRPVFDPVQLAGARYIAKGIGSSPGQASGIAVLDSDRAAERAEAGERVILVRPTTSPLDIRGMLATEGILTARGGALSHAAVVSRALDKPCIVGCEAMQIEPDKGSFTVGGVEYHEGDMIAIDGTSGFVYAGAIDLITPSRGADQLSKLLKCASELSSTTIWAATHNAVEANEIATVSVRHAIVGMTDFALAMGAGAQIVECVKRIGRPDTQALEADFTDLAKQVIDKIFTSKGALTNHIRLPRIASDRARALIAGWSDLDPRLFLPLGDPSFYRPLLDGISRAAVEADVLTTVLLTGVSDLKEWHCFREEIALRPNLAGGIVVQNVVCLDMAPTLLEDGAALWIDVNELLHSAHGFVSPHHLATNTFDDYMSRGLMQTHPRAVLKPFLASLLGKLGGCPGAAERVGVDIGVGYDPTMVRALYRLGFRIFAAPPDHIEVVSLILGQEASVSYNVK